jgi:lipopolysaccharide/colanic/teichoic acid biosynthesis glycosyltransferase
MTTGGDSALAHVWPARRRAVKRAFDLVASAVGLALLWPLIAVGWAAAQRSTGRGLFVQRRVGRWGTTFSVVKLRTMHEDSAGDSITRAGDARLTPIGRTLRRYRVDELPQLLNVLRGDMSLVGPRPDVPGYADQLTGDAAQLLSIRPGITGPATLLFRDEDRLLAAADDAKQLNDEVLYPLKVRLNLAYVRSQSFVFDLRCVVATLTGVGRQRVLTRCMNAANVSPEGLPLPVRELVERGRG